jgi:peptidoglycan/LPS O-acetylase OafA/YrhL
LLYTSGETADRWLPQNLIGWLTGLGSFAMLLYGWSSPTMQKLLSLAWLRYIGKISYSLYLLHFIVLVNITPWLLAAMNQFISHLATAWWLGLMMTIVISLLLSTIFYRLVEVPSMALGKKLQLLL